MRSLLRSVRELCPTTEGPSLRRRAVTFRSGRSPGSRVDYLGLALPIETLDSGLRPQTPLTVALPRRTLTAFPILPRWAPERAVLLCFRARDDMAPVDGLSRGDSPQRSRRAQRGVRLGGRTASCAALRQAQGERGGGTLTLALSHDGRGDKIRHTLTPGRSARGTGGARR